MTHLINFTSEYQILQHSLIFGLFSVVLCQVGMEIIEKIFKVEAQIYDIKQIETLSKEQKEIIMKITQPITEDRRLRQRRKGSVSLMRSIFFLWLLLEFLYAVIFDQETQNWVYQLFYTHDVSELNQNYTSTLVQVCLMFHFVWEYTLMRGAKFNKPIVFHHLSLFAVSAAGILKYNVPMGVINAICCLISHTPILLAIAVRDMVGEYYPRATRALLRYGYYHYYILNIALQALMQGACVFWGIYLGIYPIYQVVIQILSAYAIYYAAFKFSQHVKECSYLDYSLINFQKQIQYENVQMKE